MPVKLINHTSLDVVDLAVGKCWATGCKSTAGERDNRLIRVINKNKHGSIAEHLVYTFEIEMSRACLQELARHRMASLSVKSSRYTLKELKGAVVLSDFLVSVDPIVDNENLNTLVKVQHALNHGLPNDKVKYMLPEAYRTSLVWTINARSLQNFLSLRTSRAALWEIRDLANAIYQELPEHHKFLFKDSIDVR